VAVNDRGKGVSLTAESGGGGKKRGLYRPVALLAAVIVIIILSQVFDVGDKLNQLRGWINSLGPLGPIAFVFLYTAATVAALPGSVMSVIAAALFGPFLGVAVVIVGATVGASLAFLVSRYLARDSIEVWLSGKEKFRKLDDLSERHGDIIVAITRLVPIFPFNLLNYGFGLTKVHFRTYVIWSAVCMLPGTILYVVGSAAILEGLAEGKVPWVLVVTVAMVLAIIVILTRQARKRLREGGPEETALQTSGKEHENE